MRPNKIVAREPIRRLWRGNQRSTIARSQLTQVMELPGTISAFPMSLKQLQKALTAYHQAEALLPDLADTQLNIGLVLYNLGRKPKPGSGGRKR